MQCGTPFGVIKQATTKTGALSSSIKEDLKQAGTWIASTFKELNEELNKQKALNFDQLYRATQNQDNVMETVINKLNTIENNIRLKTTTPSQDSMPTSPYPAQDAISHKDTVLIKPSEENTMEKLYSDIVKLKPRSNLGISVNHRKVNNGIIIESNKIGDIDKLKEAISQKGLKCSVTQTNRRNPCITFKRISKEVNPNELLDDICRSTQELKNLRNQMKLLRTLSFPSSSKYNALVMISPNVYHALSSLPCVYLEWGQGIEWNKYILITQCQKCFSFDHGTKQHNEDQNEEMCSKCFDIVEDEIHECDGPKKFCPNCDCDGHRPNNTDCPIYRKMLHREEDKVDYTSNKIVIFDNTDKAESRSTSVSTTPSTPTSPSNSRT